MTIAPVSCHQLLVTVLQLLQTNFVMSSLIVQILSPTLFGFPSSSQIESNVEIDQCQLVANGKNPLQCIKQFVTSFRKPKTTATKSSISQSSLSQASVSEPSVSESFVSQSPISQSSHEEYLAPQTRYHLSEATAQHLYGPRIRDSRCDTHFDYQDMEKQLKYRNVYEWKLKQQIEDRMKYIAVEVQGPLNATTPCPCCRRQLDATHQIFKFNKCGHVYHKACMNHLVGRALKQSIKCVTCNEEYGRGLEQGPAPPSALLFKWRQGEFIQGCFVVADGTYFPFKHKKQYLNKQSLYFYIPHTPEGLMVCGLLNLLHRRGDAITVDGNARIHYNTVRLPKSPEDYRDNPNTLNEILAQLRDQGITEEMLTKAK